MRQVIVESLGGYEAARQHLGQESVTWRTTSPGLLELLVQRGEDVKSLEESVSISDQKKVGDSAYELASATADFLNHQLPIYSSNSMGLVFGEAIARLSFVMMYKALLLGRVLNESPHGILCVGQPVEPALNGITINVGRFDTLFAMLLSHTDERGVEILEHSDDPVTLEALDNWVIKRPMSIYEKLLSFCNNTPGSFAYKVWRKFQKEGILRKIRLVGKPRSLLFVYKDCELIQEAFPALLSSGAEFASLGILPSFSDDSLPNCAESIDADDINEVTSLGIQILGNHNLSLGPVLPAACNVIATRVLTAVARLRIAMPKLEAEFEAVVADVGTNDSIITNYFSTPEERLFGLWCREHGVNVVAFEHGITGGLSDWSKYPARFSGMLTASVGVYHWDNSLLDIRPWLGEQRLVMGGVPKMTSRVPLRPMQRFLSRKWLKLDARSKVVVYVADLERNNMIYGPHSENDLQYKLTTEAIVEVLMRSHPDALILLKLYPTHRYPQACGFKGLQYEYPRLRVIKDMDFRFIRAAADLIALSSNQSTLGWALGAGCPVWMFEKQTSHTKLSGRELNISVSGVRRVLELDQTIVKDTDNNVASVLDYC